MLTQVKKYFKFDETQAVLKKEIMGGLSTFLAMCYILAVNPSMVSAAPGAGGLTGGLFLATAISSFVGTFVMGLWARVPVALAPGMGINAFFTFTVAMQLGFASALSVTILSGILYLLVAITPAREYIGKQIPHNFKVAIGAGIGLFIAYIGLSNSGIIVSAASSGLISGIGDFKNPLVLLAVCLLVIGLVLHFAKVPGAFIITMFLGALIVIILSTSGVINQGVENYGLLGDYGDFTTFGTVVSSGWNGFANVEMWTNPLTYFAVFSFLYNDFFDTTGTLLSINRQANLDRISPNWLAKANQVDAVATIFGAGIGATTVTSYVESTVGVNAGARTGLAAIVTSLCFVLAIAIWPIMQVFMPIAHEGTSYQPVTSPILVIVGILMITQLKFFEWEIAVDIPMMFITLIFTLLTYSISNGIAYGMITYVLMNGALGIIQKIKNKKKVVNDITIELADDNNPNMNKTREFNYFKRLNVTVCVVAGVSLLFIILTTVQPLITG